MIGGSYYYAEERDKRKVFESAIAQKKAMEKKERWIKELEARDEEDRQIRAKKEAEKKRLEAAKALKVEKGKAAEGAAATEKGVASSVLEEAEERGVGIFEAVKELAGSRR